MYTCSYTVALIHLYSYTYPYAVEYIIHVCKVSRIVGDDDSYNSMIIYYWLTAVDTLNHALHST